jgi:hypothetical protein
MVAIARVLTYQLVQSSSTVVGVWEKILSDGFAEKKFICMEQSFKVSTFGAKENKLQKEKLEMKLNFILHYRIINKSFCMMN